MNIQEYFLLIAVALIIYFFGMVTGFKALEETLEKIYFVILLILVLLIGLLVGTTL